MLKRIISLILVMLMLVPVAVSCNKNANKGEKGEESSKGTDSTSSGTEKATDSTSASTSETTDAKDDTTTDDPQPTPASAFDENNVVLSFGAISDIHIAGGNSESESKFRAAVAQLRAQASKHDIDGLDAIAIAGDMTQDGTAAEVNAFAGIVDEMGVKNVMLTPGNHDIRNNAGKLAGYISTMGEAHTQNDVDRSMLSKGARHCVVNGAHFIFIEPVSYSNDCPYDSSVMRWLDETLLDITTEDPNAYVFLFTHPMPYDTCYGSTLSGGCWYTTHLTSTLAKYPQVMTFGGHLHFPINDERSIMQTEFTSVGCGSVRYLAIERGFSNMASATAPKDAHSVSSGLLVQMDASGNIRITRMDFSNNATFKTPWELSAPNADNSHLTKYTKGRDKTNKSPILEGTPELSTSVVPGMGVITEAKLRVPAASDDDLVHHYRVVVKNLTTGHSNIFNFLSDFYRHAKPSDMAKELVFPLDIIEEGRYSIEVVAIDSWGAESEAISCEATVGDGENNLSSVLPSVYTDFEFANGVISDTNNKFTVDMSGASIADTSVTFGGSTKTVSAFRVRAKGQHATLRFKDYNASTITNFYNSTTGFTIEALYVNYAPNGKQGIVCGTQKAGWGLAESAGKPYFYTYIDSGDINASSSTAVSKTSLNHVVCTVLYNASLNKTYTAMYVNGVLVANGALDGKLKVSQNTDIATAFCFGADIANSGKGDDFQTTDFALVDVKIYDKSLNYKQVDTAYNNALADFKK